MFLAHPCGAFLLSALEQVEQHAVVAVNAVVEVEEAAQLGAQWLREVAAQLIAEAVAQPLALEKELL